MRTVFYKCMILFYFLFLNSWLCVCVKEYCFLLALIISMFFNWSFPIFVFRSVVSQIITGYLPSLILQLFLSFVPPIMVMLSSMQGYISWSQIQKSACTKVLWFTVWNIFFANVLSGSALYRVNVFLEPKEIPRILAEAVPSQVRIAIVSPWDKCMNFPKLSNIILIEIELSAVLFLNFIEF